MMHPSRRAVLGLALALAACRPAPTARDDGPAPGTIPGPGSTVSPADTQIDAGEVDFQLDRERILGFRARPRGTGPFPAVLVLHDVRGLTPHFREVCRRLAKLGYVAFAPDALSRVGGTDNYGDPSAVAGQIARMPVDRSVNDATASISYLQGLPFSQKSAVGLIGFESGGTIGLLTGAATKEVKAVSIWYAPPPAQLDRLRNFSAPLQLHVPQADSRIRDTIDDVQNALKPSGVRVDTYFYPSASRGFHNEAIAAFDIDAAQIAWSRAVGFLNRNLRV